MSGISAQFRSAYARNRAEEGRGYRGEALRALPYLKNGPHALQWAVRARSFDAFMRCVTTPMARKLGRPLDVLDLGSGNGWLCHRVALAGHRATALDIRDDDVDGLGATAEFLSGWSGLFSCCIASFDDIPLQSKTFDIAIFNASLHYAEDLAKVLAEAARVTRLGGKLVILDSPFYASDADGMAMIAEKRAQAHRRFGARAEVLLSLPLVEYLTAERLAAASLGLDLTWSRTAVNYPLWYEARPLLAWLKGTRAPSRFDLWSAEVR